MDEPRAPTGQAYGAVTFRDFRAELTPPGILVITLNAPDRLNALTRATKRDLVELITRVQMDDAVRVVVFTGSGRAFCAGDYLGGGPQAEPDGVPVIGHGQPHGLGLANALRVYSQALNLAVRNLDKLTIAAINGPAIQTGFSLSLCCDFRIASTTAKLGSATLRFALLPDEGGQHLLVHHLGLARALDFCLRKRVVDAAQALELGLVNDVVEPGALMPAAMALASELAQGPQVAMRMLKASLYHAAETSFERALDEIALRTAVTDNHDDAHEGIAAFREKRPPAFNRWLDGEA